MKYSIFALVFALSACGAQPALAVEQGNPDYTSIKCLKFVEGDWDVVKPKLMKDLMTAADKNQKMLLEDVSQNDLVVAGTNLYCENISAKAALEWIGL